MNDNRYWIKACICEITSTHGEVGIEELLFKFHMEWWECVRRTIVIMYALGLIWRHAPNADISLNPSQTKLLPSFGSVEMFDLTIKNTIDYLTSRINGIS